uniref:Uncharacterized protein n=1 Tax=Avena sativa TaxID=4498 RepID=A0ACD5UI03_AVESA
MAEARELAVVAAAGSPSGRMKYRGVAYTPSGKCSASITEPGSKKKLWLGMYPNAEVAACAYDMAAKSLQGDKAKTNFTYPPPHHLIDAVAAAPGRRGPVFTFNCVAIM